MQGTFQLSAMAWVMVGGAIGAAARYAVSVAAIDKLGKEAAPVGTLLANVAGCFILGIVLGRLAGAGDDVGDAAGGVIARLIENRPLVATGFCGALTTFSTFGVEVVQLAQRKPIAAVGLVAAHLVLGFGAVAVGLWVAAK